MGKQYRDVPDRVVTFWQARPNASSEEAAQALGIHADSARKYRQALVQHGAVLPSGALILFEGKYWTQIALATYLNLSTDTVARHTEFREGRAHFTLPSHMVWYEGAYRTITQLGRELNLSRTTLYKRLVVVDGRRVLRASLPAGRPRLQNGSEPRISVDRLRQHLLASRNDVQHGDIAMSIYHRTERIQRDTIPLSAFTLFLDQCAADCPPDRFLSYRAILHAALSLTESTRDECS